MKSALTWMLALVAVVAVTLGGCAAVNTLSSEVSSFGEWPAARKPGSYAFERLPSQNAQAGATDALEAAARGALHKAGFTPVAAGQEPEVLVQVAARVGRTDSYYPWIDTLWWRGGFGHYRYGPWFGPRWGFGMQFEPTRYEREVALLLRDRTSGKPLFEARASSESNFAAASSTALAAMFEAALLDFPRVGMNPRQVVVQLPP